MYNLIVSKRLQKISRE